MMMKAKRMMSAVRPRGALGRLACCAALCGVIAAGCRRDEADGSPVASGDGAVRPGVVGLPSDGASGVAALPKGVDAQDDPAAPRALPKSDVLREWVKTKPVRVAGAEAMGELVGAEAASAARFYKIERAARCGYESAAARADVTLIEAATPEDAFGLFGLMTQSPGELNAVDGSVRAREERDGRVELSAWQGNAFVRVSCEAKAGGEAAESCADPFERIVFDLRSAEPPLLFQAVPAERRGQSRLWLVRTTEALRETEEPVLRGLDAAAMDARLGLDGQAWLSVAAVQVSAEERPNVLWLAEYGDAAAAQAAYARYQKALEAPSNALDGNTMVDEPYGRRLAGSWTADQESLQNFLKSMRSMLAE